MESKYFRFGDILHQPIEAKNCSYTWNGLTKGLKIVQQNFFMEVNNCRKTKIWLDRWISCLNVPPMPVNDLHRFYSVVEKLLIPNTNTWNINLLNQLFSPDISFRIQNIFMDISKEDTMIWMPSTDGKFSVKSTYKMLSKNTSAAQVNDIIVSSKTWKALWQSKVAHRVKIFAWKCIHGIHSTRVKIALYNSDIDSQCGICGMANETMEHLLFEYGHSKAVWKLLNINMYVIAANYESVSRWVEDWFSHNSTTIDKEKLFTLMDGSCILWKNKCDAVFQGVSLNPVNTTHKIHYHFHSLIHVNDMHTNHSDVLIVSRWIPPAQDSFKFNIDASYDYDTSQVATGIIIRDHTSTCVGIKGSYSDGILSPEVEECMAVFESLQWENELHFNKVHIESDAKIVIQSIVEDNLLIQWENRNILKAIKHLSLSFNSCHFSFTKRNNNQVADSIAKSVRETVMHVYHTSNFPEHLCRFMAKDLHNFCYLSNQISLYQKKQTNYNSL
ncbi:uncharacterized protein LOC113350629 [Papaver somniferum]|uniref:uncharacterized protein LOC113350629 n=1 Tax=Papaver somniferum TaxID=3469 RepID=UPI000E6FB599|nr:uncharacterized protein LOC113350629 [Papaver somniferum]